MVARSPQASLVLGQVLRATETLPVLAALDVESFAYSMLLGGKELTAFHNGSGPVICNFHVLSLATDQSPGNLRSRRARTPRPGMFAPTCLRALMTDRPGAGMITMCPS
jgi:hypothetical protein